MPDKKQKEPENPPPTAPGAAGTANAASATSNKSQARPAPTKNQSTVSGNYDPNNGVLFRALHLIENEIFYSSDSGVNEKQHRLIEDALVYLNFTVYE